MKQAINIKDFRFKYNLEEIMRKSNVILSSLSLKEINDKSSKDLLTLQKII